MKSSTMKLPDGHGSLYKEVRFSPTATPLRRTQSVSGSNPTTSSKYGHHQASNASSRGNLFALDTSYIDQSRALLESQRANFETERALFAQERRLWDKERLLLRSRIAELESCLKGQDGQSNAPANLAQPMFGTPQYHGFNGIVSNSAQVWEGTSPGGRPTRVFLDADVPDQSHLSPISEVGVSNPPSLDAALSPQARAVDAPGISVSVPIEKLDSRLDGITLKSTGLPPGVVARVITPPSPSSLETSPAAGPSASARPSVEHRNSLKLKLSELGPPNENLVRDAGHTPMAIIETDVSQRSTEQASPTEELPSKEEAPLAPVATQVHQPTETGESYFPDLPDDPALKGPLGLTNDEQTDSSFLNELDQKLLHQAKRILSTSATSNDPDETDADLPSQGDQEDPEIKFKNSTNFGTAFGLSSCGKF